MFEPVSTGSGESELVICRSENDPDPTVTHCENSDVFASGSLAVAVITWPKGTEAAKVALNVALQLASVVVVADPMNV